MTYAQAKFEVATSKTLWGEAFSRKYIIWPLTLTLGSRSHETSPSTLDIIWPMHRQNLKLLLRKVYEEMHLQENTLFDLWPWPWGQGHTKCHPVPSTLCDLCTYKVSSCYVQRFRRRYNYKKRDGRTDRRTDARTDGRRTNFGTKLIYPIFLRKSGYNKTIVDLCFGRHGVFLNSKLYHTDLRSASVNMTFTVQ